MRITGGILGRRRILVPKTNIRPTQDRVRAAIFSSLAERVGGSRVLDLFAGSGASGIEAFSRGANFVCWVESDPGALRTLRENVRVLCEAGNTPSGARTWIVRDDAIRFLEQLGRSDPMPGGIPSQDAFDIIFADPPYDNDGAWLDQLLTALSRLPILNDDGIFIMEQRARSPLPAHAKWNLTRDRKYGETRILFFQKTKPA